MIVRLTAPIEGGLYGTGEVLRLPGTVGLILIRQSQAVGLAASEVRADETVIEYDPAARRLLKGMGGAPENKALTGPADNKGSKRGRKWLSR